MEGVTGVSAVPGRARLTDDGHEHVHEHVNGHVRALIPTAAWERTHLARMCHVQAARWKRALPGPAPALTTADEKDAGLGGAADRIAMPGRHG